MNIGVCDDDERDLKLLLSCLKEYINQKLLSDSVKIYFFNSANAFLNKYKKGFFDLLILDIFVDDKNGFSFAKEIRKNDEVPIIFYSSSKGFAVEGYLINAIGYLVKPIDKDNFFNLLDKVFLKEPEKKLELKIKGKYQYFFYKDIMYCESNGRKITLFINNGKECTVYLRLDEIEQSLLGSNFLRTHKSYLINMNYIVNIDSRCFVLQNGKRVPIRVKDYQKIVKNYHNFFIGEQSNE